MHGPMDVKKKGTFSSTNDEIILMEAELRGRSSTRDTVYHIVYTVHLYQVVVQTLLQQYALCNDFYIVW